MLRIHRILRDYENAGSLNSLIALWGFVDDHAFLTKAGHLGVVYRLAGVDFECLDHAQRRDVVHRYEAALRCLDESCRVYQYLSKRRMPPIVPAPCRQPVVREAVHRRAAYLNGRRDDLFELELHLVLVADRLQEHLELRVTGSLGEAVRGRLACYHAVGVRRGRVSPVRRGRKNSHDISTHRGHFLPGRCGRQRSLHSEGRVKLAVLSPSGKEAVVAMLGPGDFFGEQALAGHPLRLTAAFTLTATTGLIVPKQQMIRLLHENHGFSDRFIAHMLARNIRIEEDLVDQLFNSSEKRLARALLLLARYGKPEETHRVLPRISQETLAEMIGTTRSRVNFFMNKFKKLGFIEYNGGLKVNHSLLTVIVHE